MLFYIYISCTPLHKSINLPPFNSKISPVSLYSGSAIESFLSPGLNKFWKQLQKNAIISFIITFSLTSPQSIWNQKLKTKSCRQGVLLFFSSKVEIKTKFTHLLLMAPWRKTGKQIRKEHSYIYDITLFYNIFTYLVYFIVKSEIN